MTNSSESLSPLPVGECLKLYALYNFDVAGRSLGLSRERIHTGVHEVRKAIRRIRAAMDLGRKQLWPVAAPVFDDLRKLCRRLSQLRDAHAVVETIRRLAKNSKDADDRALLRRVGKQLIKRRAAVLGRLQEEDPRLTKIRGRFRQLRDTAASLPWSKIDDPHISSALARSERRAERAATLASHTRHGAMRHRWRRRLRRLRRQILIVESELNGKFRRADSFYRPVKTAAVLRDITDALGFEHDLRILRTALRNTPEIGDADRARALKLSRREIAETSSPLNC